MIRISVSWWFLQLWRWHKLPSRQPSSNWFDRIEVGVIEKCPSDNRDSFRVASWLEQPYTPRRHYKWLRRYGEGRTLLKSNGDSVALDQTFYDRGHLTQSRRFSFLIVLSIHILTRIVKGSRPVVESAMQACTEKVPKVSQLGSSITGIVLTS